MNRRIFAPEWLLEELSTWRRVSHWPVSTQENGLVVSAQDRDSQRKVGLAARRLWKKLGLPKSIWHRRPTHCVRKTFKTEIELLAKERLGELTPLLMEYQLGHHLGLRGVYTDMARTYGEELCFIANLSPNIRDFVKGDCVTGVRPVRHLELGRRKSEVI